MCVCVCKCVFVCQKWPGFSKTSNLGQLFRLCWASSVRCRIFPEPEENCTLITKWTAPYLWVKLTPITPLALQQPWQPGTTTRLRPCWASPARCRVMLEPGTLSIYNQMDSSSFLANFTNCHHTGCAAAMATTHQKQGTSSCLYFRARQTIVSHHHNDCKGRCVKKWPGF